MPLLPADLGAEDAIPLIASVLAAGPTGLVSGSLEEALVAAAGPGRVLTGTVADTGSASTLKLVTQQGVDITLARPPGLSIPLGSTISLRIATASPTPQALVLTINGRPASYMPTPPADAVTPATPPEGPLRTIADPVSRQYTVSIADQTAALATSALVDLSRNALTAPLSQSNPAGSSIASAGAQNLPGLAQTLVAILVRSNGLLRAVAQPAIGTRYRVAILDIDAPPQDNDAIPGEPDTAPEQTPALSTPALEGADPAEASPVVSNPLAEEAPQTSDPVPQTDVSAQDTFVEQSAELSGRVSDVQVAGPGGPQTLVETALGTLSLPITSSALQLGSLLQLKITHVAAPPAAPSDAPSTSLSIGSSTAPIQAEPQTAASSTLIETLNRTIATAGAAPEQAALANLQKLLVLDPGFQLAAALLDFLRPSGKSGSRRALTEAAAKHALKTLGLPELSESIEAAASHIGETISAPNPRDWSVTTLPFIGDASVRPAQLYRKEVQDADGKPQPNAHRFVLDIELKRLGPLQFDGLIQDRRFDLMLRARTPLERELRSLVQHVFHDAIGTGGFTGEIGFGGLLSISNPRGLNVIETRQVDA